MEFREKIESVISPLVRDLRKLPRKLPTLELLDYYQFRVDAAGPNKANVPDGFMMKWRFLWALLLSLPHSDSKHRIEPEVHKIDNLIEKIFETYQIGAIYERGRNLHSETQFLARLGLAIRVREPDTLAFPEQISKWSLRRFSPFDASYFLFGAPLAPTSRTIWTNPNRNRFRCF